MRHKRYYTSVGIFVTGAFCIMTVSGALLYRQYRHSKIETFVMFFKGSLKGLDATTPVTYRGVKIGEVRQIEITANKAGNNVVVPVYVEFFVEKRLSFSKNPLNLLILNGFVADVSKPNLITGVADIELVKATEPRTHFKQTYFRGYPVFPTRNSVEKYTSIDETLKSAEIMFKDISRLARSKHIISTLDSTQNMAESLDKLAKSLDSNAPAMLNYFSKTLIKIGDAAQSTENLTDYLGRNPEALLWGKK